MNLYQEILIHALQKENICITFPDLRITPKEIIEMKCYQALQEIKAIIEDDSLKDNECFLKIEKMICLFEDLGSSGGTRHDFG